MGAAGFFAAIVFVGFLAALRAAGRWPAAFFFAEGLATFRATRLRATFFATVLRASFATRRRADFLVTDLAGLARLRAIGFRPRDLLADRFGAARFADFFPPDLFFAAIPTSND